MQKIISYLSIAVILALIIGIIAYQKMDKSKYMATVFINRMDTDLKQWFSKLAEICTLPFADRKYQDEMERLIREYDSVSKRQSVKKVNAVNAMRTLAVKLIGEYCPEHEEELKKESRELDDLFSDFYDMYTGYNRNANDFNREMDAKLTGLIGRILKLEKLPVMDELYILMR